MTNPDCTQTCIQELKYLTSYLLFWPALIWRIYFEKKKSACCRLKTRWLMKIKIRIWYYKEFRFTWIWFWILIFDFWLWFLIFQVQFTLAISIWSDELCQMELYVPCLNYLRPEWLTDTTWPWIPMTMFYTFLMPNPIGLFDYWTWSILLTLTLITKLSLEVESGVCQVSNYYWFYIL